MTIAQLTVPLRTGHLVASIAAWLSDGRRRIEPEVKASRAARRPSRMGVGLHPEGVSYDWGHMDRR